MKYIKWFREISKKDIGLVGGKGANLGEMTKMRLPVPPGFVVTSRAYDFFLKENNLTPIIKETLKGLSEEDTAKISRAAKKIQNAIQKSKMPALLSEEIENAYKKLGRNTFVAIRSSATAEDLPTASFAGQQATFLNIKGADNVVRAVQKCFASLFEPRAIYYRIKNKFDHMKVKLAAPVQEMVQSEKSGIMFSLDPLMSNKTKIVIEAGYGLGEAVVSGSITPDRYVLDKKNLQIVGREIHKQTWAIKKVDGSNKHITVAKNEQEKQKIKDDEIINLARYAIKIEKHYKTPQDMEWALAAGKLYFVQTRPVTTIKKELRIKNYFEQSEKKGSEEQGDEGSYELREKPTSEILVKGLGASIGSASGPVCLIKKPGEKFEKGQVLVTEFTNPSFVPLMQKAVAIVTDTGGSTSHAAIVSREMGIPCVVGAGDATHKLKNGQMVTVDGAHGVVYKGEIQNSNLKMQNDNEKLKINSAENILQKTEAPITATKVYVNLAEPQIAGEVAKEPCDGVGLLRAEFMIAGIGEHPRAMVKKGKGKEFAKQLSEGIKQIAQAFHPRPVVYRATDFKTNEYSQLPGGKEFEPEEENPMLGYRGAFRYIKEPDIFSLELWALRRVRDQFGLNNVWLMIPFVRTVEELEKVQELIHKDGILHTHDFKLWMMVEVPSNVFLIDKFCECGIDGVSLGTNDLTQLILGVDRDSKIMAEEFDERNEAVILAVKKVIESCRRHNLSVSVCGQAPSVYPEFSQMLVESGITSVSVNPDKILDTKKLIASIEKRILLDKVKEIEGLNE